MTVPEVVSEVVKDQVFFDESQGGVTISGGEPLAQASFVEALLADCRSRGLRTAVDTCGYGDPGKLGRISQHADLFLFDLKLMDCERHQRFTGVPNDVILANLRMLAARGSEIIVRMPVIPGINDDRDNIEALGRFLLDTPLRRIDLLPYHRFAFGKYKRLQLDCEMSGVKPPTREEMMSISAGPREAGFDVRIGG